MWRTPEEWGNIIYNWVSVQGDPRKKGIPKEGNPSTQLNKKAFE